MGPKEMTEKPLLSHTVLLHLKEQQGQHGKKPKTPKQVMLEHV